MSNQKMKNSKLITHNHNYEKNTEKYDICSDSEHSETEETSSKQIILYKKLLKEIAETLTSIISQKSELKKNVDVKTPFDHMRIPQISIYDYLLRIQKYSDVENNTLIIALIYIDRICKKKGITLNKYNIYRILFTAILVSIKYNEDHIYDNLYYSKIAGLPVKEINYLERKFLEIINYDLFVSEELFQKYYEYLN
jgi:hypothetical protein